MGGPRRTDEEKALDAEVGRKYGGKGLEELERARLLRGWKEIATWLGVNYRTAMRWHRDWGMPVVRVFGRTTVTHPEALVEWFFRVDRMQRKVLAEAAESNDQRGRMVWLREVRSRGRLRPSFGSSRSGEGSRSEG